LLFFFRCSQSRGDTPHDWDVSPPHGGGYPAWIHRVVWPAAWLSSRPHSAQFSAFPHDAACGGRGVVVRASADPWPERISLKLSPTGPVHPDGHPPGADLLTVPTRVGLGPWYFVMGWGSHAAPSPRCPGLSSQLLLRFIQTLAAAIGLQNSGTSPSRPPSRTLWKCWGAPSNRAVRCVLTF